MPRQSPRQRICRLARSFIRARDHFAAMEDDAFDAVITDEERGAACGRMFAYRRRLVDAVLDAVGHDVDSGPAVVNVGRLIIAIDESPEDKGLGVQAYEPVVVVIDKDLVLRLARGVGRA